MSLICSERYLMESAIIAFSGSTLRPISWKAHESAELWHFHHVFVIFYGVRIFAKDKTIAALRFGVNRELFTVTFGML